VRVVQGTVLDVAVDIRKLNHAGALVWNCPPKTSARCGCEDFAHGFVVLSGTEFL
jgi:dTDP-4-dehydrorhamnose 3,5-epimerase-like enzyme